MKLYFYDGKLTSDFIQYFEESHSNVLVLDASIGYTESVKTLNEAFYLDTNVTVLTNCVYVLNHKGIWQGEGNKSLNPNVYIYDSEAGIFKRANDICRIRYGNNIETMYRSSKFCKLIDLDA